MPMKPDVFNALQKRLITVFNDGNSGSSVGPLAIVEAARGLIELEEYRARHASQETRYRALDVAPFDSAKLL
jgi:hypothetical protein